MIIMQLSGNVDFVILELTKSIFTLALGPVLNTQFYTIFIQFLAPWPEKH